MNIEKTNKNLASTEPTNKTKEDNDKAPGEERGKGELVTPENLKGKKVDANPADETDKPIDILKQDK